MDQHEFRLTWMFLGYGVLAGGVLAFIFPSIIHQFKKANTMLYGKADLSTFQQTMVFFVLAQPAIVLVAGILSSIKKTTEHLLAILAAAALLVTFPIGTAIGGYYFWHKYYFSKPTGLA